MQKLYIIAVVISLVFTISSCGSNVEIGELQGVEINKLGLKKININVRLPIDNKSFYKIHITDINVDVSLDDKYFGRLTSTDTILLKSRAKEVHTINLDVTVRNLILKSVKLIGLLKEGKTKVKMIGTVTAQTFFTKKTIYIDEEKEIDVFK